MTEAQAAALRLTARLLAYPNPDWLASLTKLRQEALAHAAEEDTAAFGSAALEFIDACLVAPTAELTQRYVAIFDHLPRASLYMTWHRYGNDRSQGKAMGALNGLYRVAGFEPLPGDMPDYLPRMLEFISIAPEWACEAVLDGFGPEIATLANTLKEVEAIQAPVLELALAPLRSIYPGHFAPRNSADPTRRPMARPEAEPLEPLLPIPGHRQSQS